MHVGTGEVNKKERGIMKTIALTLLGAALAFAQTSTSTAANPPSKQTDKAVPTVQRKKAAQSSKPSLDSKAKAQAQTPSIPAGAKLVEPNLYRFTDSNGKTWNYRQTPFGISKWEEKPAAAQPVAEPTRAKTEPVVVTDLGDSYRFEKNTPFGRSSWVRKKSQLTDEEKTLAGVPTTPSDPGPNTANSKAPGNQ